MTSGRRSAVGGFYSDPVWPFAVLFGAVIGAAKALDVISSQGYVGQAMWWLVTIEIWRGLGEWIGKSLLVAVVIASLGWLLQRLPDRRRPGTLAAFVATTSPALALLLLGGYALGLGNFYDVTSVRGAAVRIALLVVAGAAGWRFTNEPARNPSSSRAGRLVRVSAGAVVAIVAVLYVAVALHGRVDAPKGPNIVLVYFDALRADHLSAYGYSRPTSPHIDAFARQGVLFQNVTSQASATFPSVPSTLTSRYSSEFFDSTRAALPDRFLTLAEILKNRGYRTVAFSSSPMVAHRRPHFTLGGFDQGFDSFDDSAAEGEERNWQWKSPEAIVDRAVAWLERRPAGKFFLFLYIEDPHGPYRPAPPYDRLYDPDYRGKEWIEYGEPSVFERVIHWGFDPGLDAADIRHLVARYDGEITGADAELGRFLDRLTRKHLADDTLVVITSDHGEEFYDHGCLQHTVTLYQEVLRVPLILRWPAGLPQGVVIDKALVRSLDITPTILGLAGIELPATLAGRSLQPLIMDPHAEWPDVILSETPYSDAKAIRSGRWKYIHHFELSTIEPDLSPRFRKGTELYDLETDAKEKHNLLDDRPDIARDLHAKMMETLPDRERRRLGSKTNFTLDEQTIERLRSLGYLQ